MTDRPGPAALPGIGTRVSLRYLRPAGSSPPMADVVGHLVEAGQRVRVRSADGQLHELRRADVLYVRQLTDRPVKNSAIRAVEHAAALAWPGTEHQWLDGWFLRAGHGCTRRANSAVPLDMFARADTIPAIIDWYARRGLAPLLAVPERLLQLPADAAAECEIRTLVGDLADDSEHSAVAVSAHPDAAWLDRYGHDVDVRVLTAVAGGELAFASIPGVAIARGAVTDAPDGTRWLGLSALRLGQGHVEDRRGADPLRHGRTVCAALRSWAAARGATRAYGQVRSDDPDTFVVLEAVGFTAQHRTRYFDARSLRP